MTFDLAATIAGLAVAGIGFVFGLGAGLSIMRRRMVDHFRRMAKVYEAEGHFDGLNQIADAIADKRIPGETGRRYFRG